MSEAKPTTISARRMKAAVAAIKPHVLQPTMLRQLLRQEGWTPEEIDEHAAAVARAVADDFAGGV